MMTSKQRPALRAPVVAPKAAPATGGVSSYRAPSRAGKRGITFYLETPVWKQVRRLSVDADATIQDLMEEAVGLLLAKHDVQSEAA
jgi:hypothetical protein